MNKLVRLASAAALLGGGMVAIAPATFAQMDHGSMPRSEMSSASMAYGEVMKKMDADMSGMKMTGKPGVDFALMMIPHHQSAIDMANAYLASGDDNPQLTRLANEIIVAQESEIAFLNAWLKENGER